MSWLRIDSELQDAVATAIGVRAGDGVEQVVDRFRHWLPMGSTAKWAAVDRDEPPPGADPTEALRSRLAGSLDSWSCWPVCTSLGALLAGRGHDVTVAVEHRRGPGTPVVDYHSVLVVDGALVDAYLGPSAPVPLGHDVSRPDAWGAWVPSPDGRHDHLGGRGRPFRYRLLASHLDRDDIAAFCAISATHTGVGRRRTAHWLTDGRMHTLREAEDGTAELRVVEGDSPWTSTRRLVGQGIWEDMIAAALL